jgi:SAM-dependent methyltransferase
MTDWTSGYVADIGYTYGYYAELNPLRAKLALLNARLALPKAGTACELGFGQGVSTNIHAAASATRWYGTDFNPSQAGFAQQLADSVPDGAQLYDQSFAEFCTRDDLPDFDYIGLHGIWSWISDENRAVIVDFVRRKLKPGGILYISYNTQPGWAPMVPLRNLLVQHADTMAASGAGAVARVDGALQFAKKLLATNPNYAKVNPQIAERLKQIETQDRHYVAHEYFNRDWLPMSFSQMAGWLSPAKLDFACSATYLDHVPAVHLTTEQRAMLDELTDQVFRQSVRDFMVNQQFRRDYWVKGQRTLNAVEYAEQLRALRVVMTARRESITLKVTGTLGEATLNEATYGRLLDLMGDYKVRSIGEIEQRMREHGISLAQLQESMLLLGEKNAIAVVNDEATASQRRPHTDALNRALLLRARGSADIASMVSPLLGSGIPVGRFEQLFMLSLASGGESPKDWANYAWQILKSQGQLIIKDGQTLKTDEENIAELLGHATEFSSGQLPLLRALLVL